MTTYTDLELRSLLLNESISTEEYCEFLLIPKLFSEKSNHKRKIFDIKKMNNYQCERNFRFNHEELDRLKTALGIPDEMHTVARHKFSGIEGLCVLLRRLSYTNRWFDLVSIFKRDETALIRIFNMILDFTYDKYKHLLNATNQAWVSKEYLHQYSEAIARKGNVKCEVVGIIDGTCRRICRPKLNQKLFYSGHKKYHCVKFQGVTFPNGYIGHLDGGYPGSRHDSAIYWLSGLSRKLGNYLPYEDNKWYRLYGDQGYSNTKFVISPYRGNGNLNSLNNLFNDFMKKPRQSVEWSFGCISRDWDFVNCHLQSKLYKNKVEKIYFVSALLSNFKNCLRPNIVSNFFSILPLSLEDYIKTE